MEASAKIKQRIVLARLQAVEEETERYEAYLQETRQDDEEANKTKIDDISIFVSEYAEYVSDLDKAINKFCEEIDRNEPTERKKKEKSELEAEADEYLATACRYRKQVIKLKGMVTSLTLNQSSQLPKDGNEIKGQIAQADQLGMKRILENQARTQTATTVSCKPRSHPTKFSEVTNFSTTQIQW